MRLTQIKLAGFKSFVDPTTIATPGQLVGIVGPNGCGKSNVIDAVRWVLGESKASALRGESMQDVIFNGAGDRKPVGRASVELSFDNSAGRIGGQWGQYAELSIKRVLTRDGDSSLLHQRHPGPPPRHLRPVPRHRPRPPRLRDHRAGDDLARDRGEARGAPRLPRGGRGRLEVPRAAQGDRGTPRRHAREPRRASRTSASSSAASSSASSTRPKVAGEYREMEARLKQAQHLSWYAKQQEAVRARDRANHELRRGHDRARGAAGRAAQRRGRARRRCAATTTPRATRCTTSRARSTRPTPRSRASSSSSRSRATRRAASASRSPS